jgi:hypothetical protein
LTGILDEIGGLNTGSIGSSTCSTKPTNVINLTGWFDQTHVGITIVFIENSPSFVVNIKSSFSSDISEWKS